MDEKKRKRVTYAALVLDEDHTAKAKALFAVIERDEPNFRYHASEDFKKHKAAYLKFRRLVKAEFGHLLVNRDTFKRSIDADENAARVSIISELKGLSADLGISKSVNCLLDRVSLPAAQRSELQGISANNPRFAWYLVSKYKKGLHHKLVGVLDCVLFEGLDASESDKRRKVKRKVKRSRRKKR